MKNGKQKPTLWHGQRVLLKNCFQEALQPGRIWRLRGKSFHDGGEEVAKLRGLNFVLPVRFMEKYEQRNSGLPK